jgi:hypothetical protein
MSSASGRELIEEWFEQTQGPKTEHLYAKYFDASVISHLYVFHGWEPSKDLTESEEDLWLKIQNPRSYSYQEVSVVNWFATRDFEIIRAAAPGDAEADERRLTHDTVRRVSKAGLLFIAATQLIYLLTGVVILHPAAAVILTLLGLGFHRMSTLMRRELIEVLHTKKPNSGSAEQPLEHAG